jgi:flagellar protein FlaG
MFQAVANAVPVEPVRPVSSTAPTAPAARAMQAHGLHAKASPAGANQEPGSLSADFAELSDTLSETWLNVEYSLDKDTHKIVTKVVNRDTGEVIRQMPTEEMLQVTRTLTKLQGLLVNQSA